MVISQPSLYWPHNTDKMKKRRLILLLGLFLLIPPLLLGGFLLADRLFPLVIEPIKPTQTILAADGRPLWRFADENGIWRYPVTLSEVPDYYLQALLTYEDKHFYQHHGINFFALARAAWQNLRHGRIISGGSTLTMQVARIIDPHERTLLGKLQQMFRTLQLEWHFSKAEILTLYINRAPYGGTLEGIGAASWSYLGKAPQALTRSEAILMAVLPQAPSRLRPDRYPARAQQARDKVLDRLSQADVWPAAVIAEVKAQEVWVLPRKTPQLAPLLARRLSNQYPEQDIIETTLDSSLQSALEDIANNWRNRLPPKTSLAILVVDHTDMQVKSYVGSIDFNDDTRFGQVDMIRAWRSPGSTLKPFLYGLALNEGLIHSQSLLQDIPLISRDYRPSNFDEGFSGPVSVAEALAKSLNLPAVQLLAIYGPKRFASQLNAVGLQFNANSAEPNLTYILGGASVKMEQLVSLYSAFARQGSVAELRFLTRDPLIERPLFSAGSAWVIRRILAGELSPPAQVDMSGELSPIAWKTGTSYGYRDAWSIGVNPRYLIGVWVGRPDGTPVAGQYGTVTALPILQQVNRLLLNRERTIARFSPAESKPQSVSLATICWPTGQSLPPEDSNCQRRYRAWVVDNIIPPTLEGEQSADYYADAVTLWVNRAGYRVAFDCPGAQEKKIALWPIGLENWLPPEERRAYLIPPNDSQCPPLNERYFSPLRITGLTEQQRLKPLPGQRKLTFSLNSQGGFGSRWWFLDGDLVSSTAENSPIEIEISRKGAHQLLVFDEGGQIARMAFMLE